MTNRALYKKSNDTEKEQKQSIWALVAKQIMLKPVGTVLVATRAQGLSHGDIDYEPTRQA